MVFNSCKIPKAKKGKLNSKIGITNSLRRLSLEINDYGEIVWALPFREREWGRGGDTEREREKRE